jgi:hypothetical protein
MIPNVQALLAQSASQLRAHAKQTPTHQIAPEQDPKQTASSVGLDKAASDATSGIVVGYPRGNPFTASCLQIELNSSASSTKARNVARSE